MKLKNKMIIVCGGRGKRMGKITTSIPKPLIKIGNVPIIEHKLRYYKSQGLSNFIFCLGYKSDQLMNFLKKKNFKSIFNIAGVNAGILKRIFLVKDYIKDSTIISYGDTLAKINFKNLINSHKKSNCALTIVVAPIQNPFGLVSWDAKGKATNFNEKPILNHFIGYAVVNPNFFKKINNKFVNLKNGRGIVQAIKILIKKKQVNIYSFKNLQITINSPEELKYARLNYKKYFTL
ncbi:MAG: sugar phosphate nucleotidyltransferase [Pseudomonadota bacterium]|nr:sugar phosphate nucleotidyltransferase [Pseudomonadota bacterium]